MRYLIDTHILLWAQDEPARLKPGLLEILEDPEHEIAFSAVSIWEIAIKARRRADFIADAHKVYEAALEAGFVEIPVYSAAASRVAHLPLHHGDPFDRLLIAQAMSLPARFLTADRHLAAYSELVTVV